MDGDRMAALDRVIAAIQRRWGERALHRLGRAPRSAAGPALPTGFADLDAALGTGGFPCGRMTELLGMPTSGKTTIALRVLASAQRLGERVGYVDLPAAFDPEYAAWCGVDLAALLLVRPQRVADAPELILALLASGGLGALVVDDLAVLQATPQDNALLDRMLRLLPQTRARSPCALVILTALPYRPDTVRSIGFHGSGLAHAATLRLHIAREAWLDGPTAALGCHARVTVLKHALAPPGAQAHITVPFDDAWNVL